MSDAVKGFLEGLSWGDLIALVTGFLTVFCLVPDYFLNVRPQLEKATGAYALGFAEGTIFSAVVVLIVLKAISRAMEHTRIADSSARQNPTSEQVINPES